MKYNIKKKFYIMITLTFVISIFCHSLTATYNHNSTFKNDYINISAEQAWIMLNDPSPENGIQIPIDVRRDDEWKVEHIDTPSPENPIHYPLTDLQDPVGLQIFLSTYSGNEIIIYCRSGSRSVTAANILVANGFNGTIYNMLGGINSWKASGYPTKGNQIPSIPEISGPSSGMAGEEYEYTLLSSDPDNDDILYCIDWGDDTGEICIGPYSSGEEITASHTWTNQDTYTIKVKARDYYLDESDWATLEVSMPVSYNTIYSMIFGFFERYPRMFPLIRNILGL